MNYLGYNKEDFEKAMSTLEKVSKYINGGFLVVGGLVKRTLFPEFIQKSELNDLDLVFYPARKENLLNSDIKKEFYIGFIAQENYSRRKGFYFAVIDKKNFVKVDLFMPERDLRTQKIKIGKKEYDCRINEEIYLKNLRDFWYGINAKTNIDPKELELLNYLEKNIKLDTNILEELWDEEKGAIKSFCRQEGIKRFGDEDVLKEFLKKSVDKEFDSFKEYKNAVRKIIIENKYLIKPRKKKSEWKYPKNCPKGWGLEIEDEETFEMIKEKYKSMGK